MNTNQGLTLVEVIVGIAIFAIGILGAAQLQVGALGASNAAAAVKEVTHVVTAEQEWRRQTSLELGTSTCQSTYPPHFSQCKVQIDPCVMLTGQNSFTCGPAAVSPIAYRVTVTATGARNKTMTLTSTYTGIYVAGSAGTIDTTYEYPDSEPEDPTGSPVSQ